MVFSTILCWFLLKHPKIEVEYHGNCANQSLLIGGLSCTQREMQPTSQGSLMEKGQ